MATRKKRTFLWITLPALPLLAGAAFFSVKALSRTTPKIDAEKLARVERMDLARSVVATGKIEPVTKVEIKSKASGIIQKLPLNVGDRVQGGQVLCELDKNDLQPRVREAQASLAVSEAALKSGFRTS
jgi:HlyD family secretion protein